jgi:hypothetical protein
MTRRVAHLIWLLFLGWSAAANAQDRTRATVVYDVKLREFPCWQEGDLTAAARSNPCSTAQGWHPVTSDLYFTRGEAISVLLVNAVAMNLFTVEVSGTDLPEPTTPIQGTVSELPKLLSLVSPPTVVAAPNASPASLSSGSRSVQPTELYRRLTSLEEKDFTAWLRATLIAPLATKEVGDFLGLDTTTILDQLKATTPGWIKETVAIVDGVHGIASPRTTTELIDATRTLAKLLGDQLALHNRLTAVGVPQQGKTISDAIKALNSGPLRDALAIAPADFLALVSEFNTAFPSGLRYSRIAAITTDKVHLIVDPKYVDERNPTVEMAGFLARVEKDAGGSVTPAQLARLKKNLVILADTWSDVLAARQRHAILVTAETGLDGYQASMTGVFELQRRLNEVADATIKEANLLNAAANTLPLEERLRVLPVGQWFGSKTITVTIKQGQRAALFDLGGVSDAARATVVATPENQSAKATQPAPAALAEVRTFQFPVYNLYHFQLGFGAVFSNADDKRYQVTTVTTGSTSEKFIDQTISRGYNVLWTVNLVVFPAARHAFPWRARYPGERAPCALSNFGAAIGFSMTEPNRNVLLGGAWFPQRGAVGVQFGYHIAMRDVPTGDLSKALTERATIFERKRFNGAGIGLLVTPDFFTKVLAPIFKP